MKLSKKQIIYGSVLLAAAGAYCIDAALFGPPSAAKGDVAAAADASASPAQTATAGAATSDNSEHLITQRLNLWTGAASADPRQIEDVFSSTLIKPMKRQQVVAEAAQPVEDPAIGFGRRHHLVAIVLENGSGFALVDAQVVHVRQTFNGAKLIGLSRNQAKFSVGTTIFEMNLTADVGAGH